MRIDRTILSVEEAIALDDAGLRAAERRQRNALANRCINETKRGDHGLATHGTRCLRCHLVHKYGAIVAYGMDAYREAKAVQP